VKIILNTADITNRGKNSVPRENRQIISWDKNSPKNHSEHRKVLESKLTLFNTLDKSVSHTYKDKNSESNNDDLNILYQSANHQNSKSGNSIRGISKNR
jgi:hypothetical protein